MTDAAFTDRSRLLEPAFTAAHRALIRMEDADVPAALRQVRAASKNRRLPPPHRRVLADHLEAVWLRDLAIVELSDGTGVTSQASRLYLERPDGWQDRLDELSAASAERLARHDIESVNTEKDRLGRINEELTQRLEQSEERVADLQQRLDSDERLAAVRHRLEDVTRHVGKTEAAVADREAVIARLEAELTEAIERIEVLRVRAARGPDVESGSDVGSRAFGRGNPIEAARFLDELAAAMRPGSEIPTSPPQVVPLALPPGVRPDSPDAIEWIKTIRRKVLLIVDGHNVAHDLAPDPGRTARDRVVSETARLKMLTDGPLAAIVFFDTDKEPEVHGNFGVSVRYVRDADAAIEQAVSDTHIDCVVISTDREVRTRSRRHGALTLWGTAFSDWIARR